MAKWIIGRARSSSLMMSHSPKLGIVKGMEKPSGRIRFAQSTVKNGELRIRVGLMVWIPWASAFYGSLAFHGLLNI